ncbi:MAG: hypothetical protein AAB508_05010 [Patescibacteria group bacterium]
MKRLIPSEIKKTAQLLRKKGFSIGQIAKEIQVSKSTVHEWVKTIKGANRYAQIGKDRWIREIQPLGAIGQKKKREKKIALIEEDTQAELLNLTVTPEILKTVLAALYWAEGTKGRGMLKFTNTDPKLMCLFITLLRQCYMLDESKFRVRLQFHWYHKAQKVKNYWSYLLKIPQEQFRKTYRKKRSKQKVFRKNVGGICFLQYNSDHLREQLLHYSYAFGEKITGKIEAPVA